MKHLGVASLPALLSPPPPRIWGGWADKRTPLALPHEACGSSWEQQI